MKRKAANKALTQVLQNELIHVDKLWGDKEVSRDFIIGYLTGLVKMTIEELND